MTPETVAPGISPAYGLAQVDALAGNFRLAAGEQTHELPGQVRRPDDPAFGGVVAAVALAGGTLVLGLDGFLARGGHLKELVVGMGAAYGRELLGMAAPRHSRSQPRITAAVTSGSSHSLPSRGRSGRSSRIWANRSSRGCVRPAHRLGRPCPDARRPRCKSSVARRAVCDRYSQPLNYDGREALKRREPRSVRRSARRRHKITATGGAGRLPCPTFKRPGGTAPHPRLTRGLSAWKCLQGCY